MKRKTDCEKHVIMDLFHNYFLCCPAGHLDQIRQICGEKAGEGVWRQKVEQKWSMAREVKIKSKKEQTGKRKTQNVKSHAEMMETKKA